MSLASVTILRPDTKFCDQCGKSFAPYRPQDKSCGAVCAAERQRKYQQNYQRKAITRYPPGKDYRIGQCQQCDGPMPMNRANRRYCSKSCNAKGYRLELYGWPCCKSMGAYHSDTCHERIKH